MSPQQERYVIGIGAQKAGTSWLSDYFGSLPEMCTSPIKELHFFDAVYRRDLSGSFETKFVGGLKRLAQDVRSDDPQRRPQRLNLLSALVDRVAMADDVELYREYFRRRAQGRHIFCEITPGYAVLEADGFRAMRDLAEDVRLVFLMRDPVERLWSALRMQDERLMNKTLVTAVPRMLRRPENALRSDYRRTLEAVYEVFPQDRVFVGFYESLFQPETIQRLCAFCGVNYVEPDFGKMVRQGTAMELPTGALRAARQALDSNYIWARESFGDQVPANWHA